MKKVIILLLVLAGCAHHDVVQLSPDTYVINRTDPRGVFGNPAAMKTRALQDADEFAAAQGKKAVAISVTETPFISETKKASIEYQFKLVPEGNQSPQKAVAAPLPNTTAAEKKVAIPATESKPKEIAEKPKAEAASVEKTIKEPSDKPKDFYSELIKLDDLRKRGIITEAEFTQLKQKIISSQ